MHFFVLFTLSYSCPFWEFSQNIHGRSTLKFILPAHCRNMQKKKHQLAVRSKQLSRLMFASCVWNLNLSFTLRVLTTYGFGITFWLRTGFDYYVRVLYNFLKDVSLISGMDRVYTKSVHVLIMIMFAIWQGVGATLITPTLCVEGKLLYNIMAANTEDATNQSDLNTWQDHANKCSRRHKSTHRWIGTTLPLTP